MLIYTRALFFAVSGVISLVMQAGIFDTYTFRLLKSGGFKKEAVYYLFAKKIGTDKAARED